MPPLIVVLLLAAAAFACTFGLCEWLAKRIHNATRDRNDSLR